MKEAFVYCWTDHLTGKLYVGSHKGETTDGYICSSKHMMKEFQERPNNFTRQIIAEGCYDDIRKLESVILQTVNAKMDEQFYNRHNNRGDYYRGSGFTITEEHKRKIGQSKVGKKRPDIAARNRKYKSKEMKKWRAENDLNLTDEVRKKMSESAKRRASTKEGREALKKASHSRKPRTPEQNKRHAEAMRAYHKRKRAALNA